MQINCFFEAINGSDSNFNIYIAIPLVDLVAIDSDSYQN